MKNKDKKIKANKKTVSFDEEQYDDFGAPIDKTSKKKWKNQNWKIWAQEAEEDEKNSIIEPTVQIKMTKEEEPEKGENNGKN